MQWTRPTDYDLHPLNASVLLAVKAARIPA